MNVSVNPFVNLTKHRPEFDDRYRGEKDEFGFNLDTFCDWEPIFRFFYDDYFSVQTIGMENIPANGRAVLAGNHSGGLPIDAFMTSMAIYNLHPHPRRVRFLSLDCLKGSAPWRSFDQYGRCAGNFCHRPEIAGK